MGDAEVTGQQVLQLLRTVPFPGLSRDIVSLGFVRDLEVEDGHVSFRVEITPASRPAAQQIKRDCEDRLRSVPGVHALTIRLEASQTGEAPGTPPAGPGRELLPDVRFKECGNREEIFKHGGGRTTAARLGVPFLGEIPVDPKIVLGGDSGTPIVALEPESAAARAYMSVAEAVAKSLGA